MVAHQVVVTDLHTSSGANRRGAGRFLTVPAFVWFVLFMLAPMVMLFVVSVGQRGHSGGYLPGFTLDGFAEVTNRLSPILNTLQYSIVGAGITLLAAYPLAYYLGSARAARASSFSPSSSSRSGPAC